MSESIIARREKTTENYAVYESPDVGTQDMTGTYISLAAFGGEPPEFIEVRVGDDESVAVNKNKDTTNYGVFESESGAIGGMYISHDVLGSEETEEGDRVAPDETAIGLSTDATEEDFEEADEELQEEADSLLAEAGDEDAVEVEETSEEEEAEKLLDEAAEA